MSPCSCEPLHSIKRNVLHTNALDILCEVESSAVITIQYYKILQISQQWRGQNIDQRMNIQKTQHVFCDNLPRYNGTTVYCIIVMAWNGDCTLILYNYWCKSWLYAWLAPSHYLNQRCHILVVHSGGNYIKIWLPTRNPMRKYCLWNGGRLLSAWICHTKLHKM